MSDCRGPRHEEDGISQVICYLLGAFTIGVSLALFIIVERLWWLHSDGESEEAQGA